jgi:hypothetical protein
MIPMTDRLPKITLLFAVPFASPQELLQALRNERDYQLTGPALRTADGTLLELDARPQDGEFADIVSSGTSHPPTNDEIKRMRAAPTLLTLSGPGGSPQAAQRMLAAGAMLMRIGAAGVLVYNSGLGHGASDWCKLADDPDAGIHWAFVGTTSDPKGRTADIGMPCIYSTGMHVMGLRDVVVPATGDQKADWFHVNNYCGYLQKSGRIPVDGDVLTAVAGETDAQTPQLVPMFRVRYAPCTSFPPDSPMFNPYGMYVLHPLDPEDPQALDYLPSNQE